MAAKQVANGWAEATTVPARAAERVARPSEHAPVRSRDGQLRSRIAWAGRRKPNRLGSPPSQAGPAVGEVCIGTGGQLGLLAQPVRRPVDGRHPPKLGQQGAMFSAIIQDQQIAPGASTRTAMLAAPATVQRPGYCSRVAGPSNGSACCRAPVIARRRRAAVHRHGRQSHRRCR